jgi:acetoacetyl-CoA synthetase
MSTVIQQQQVREGDLLWTPSRERLAAARLTGFAERLAAETGSAFPDDQALWRWSVEDPGAFWSAVWDLLGVIGDRGDGPALADRRLPDAAWFAGAQLNYAEQALVVGEADDVALISVGEQRAPQALSRADLREAVAAAAAGLRALGVRRGDRVAALLPNGPEAIVGLLAAASLGAVWCSCSPDFGAAGAADRFAQVEPAVLVACDGYRYAGRAHDRRGVVAELQRGLPSLRHTVLVPCLDGGADLRGVLAWDELLGAGDANAPLERVPFEHPLWILFSSGTTGPPKALVHGHGGIVLEHLKQLALHLDVHPGDRLLWFTTTGWMMWNLQASALLCGATPVLYDGSPTHPGPDALWRAAADTGTTLLGTSPAHLGACRAAGVDPGALRGDALRTLGVTGSPLSPELAAWASDALGPDVWPVSISGGTDVCTAFLGGWPTAPVRAGELQRPALGAAVGAAGPDGEPLRPGEVGELVLREPLPSMPVALWGDEDGSRLHETYFAALPGLWRHGDWVRFTDEGSAVVLGRSDATINRNGVRIGTAELYRAVSGIPEVDDVLAVDVRCARGSELLLFVVLADGAPLDDDLRARVAARIREDCSPRHVPDALFAVPALPRTRTGKLVEVPVKRLLEGAPVDEVLNGSTLADPTALEPFVALAEERAA